jgi:hypothetical protein
MTIELSGTSLTESRNSLITWDFSIASRVDPSRAVESSPELLRRIVEK